MNSACSCAEVEAQEDLRRTRVEILGKRKANADSRVKRKAKKLALKRLQPAEADKASVAHCCTKQCLR